MRDPADRCVHARAPQFLRLHRLPDGALDQIGTPEPHEAGALHHHDHVRERRQVGAPRDAGTHDRRDLGDAQVAAHEGVVVEDARGPVLSGEDASLVRQVDPRRVHEIDDGDAAAHGDLLRPQDLGDGLGPPGARLDGRVVGDHDNLAAVDPAHAGDHPGGGRAPVVEVMRHQQADLHEGLAGVEQRGDAFARRPFPPGVLALDALRPATQPQPRPQILELLGEPAYARHARTGGGITSGAPGASRSCAAWAHVEARPDEANHSRM